MFAFKKLIIHLLFIVLILATSSCAKQTDVGVTDDVVFSANNLLNGRDCEGAIRLLEGHGMRETHAHYLQALASAYACRSGYDEPNFYGTNLPTLGSGLTSLFGSLVKWDTSYTESAYDDNYDDLWYAIQILLYAGGINGNPSATKRSGEFPTDDANDINVQLLYMLLSQMGKYSFLYGNANPTAGTKGNGASTNGNPNNNSNTCYTEYTLDLFSLLDVDLGSCNTSDADTNVGHPAMTLPGISQELYVSRMCQGIVMFNNFVDVLGGAVLSSSIGNFGDLQDTITEEFTNLCSNLSTIAPTVDGDALCNMRSQELCEQEYGTNPNDTTLATGSNALQVYTYVFFETLFQ